MYVRRCSSSCISDSDTWCVSMSTSTSMSRLTCLNHQAGDLIHDHLLEHFLFQFVVLSLLRYCSLLHACLQFSFFHVQANPSYFSSSLLFCFITLQSNDICIHLRLPFTHKSYLFHLPMQINRLLLIVYIIPYQEPARLVWNLQAPQWQ